MLTQLHPKIDYEIVTDDTPLSEDERKEISIGQGIYEKVCHLMNFPNDILYYTGTYQTIYIKQDAVDISMEIINYNKSDIHALLTEEERGYMLRYMLRHRRFLSKPFISKYCYLAEENKSSESGFTMRTDLENLSTPDLYNSITRAEVFTNYFTGEFKCFVPLNQINSASNYNQQINDVLRIIFPEDEERKTIKDFMALYAFENRYGKARPTLIMNGVRGTGKNLFADIILASIYRGQTTALPSNFKTFNGFLENKCVVIDEQTKLGGNDPLYLYDYIKRLSGSRFAAINEKNKGVKTVLTGTYIIICTNEQPLRIRDAIDSPSNNQFIVIRAKNSKVEALEKYKLEVQKLGFSAYEDFFNYAMGYYVMTELFDVYKQMKLESKTKAFRYGMEIPIFEGLKHMMAQSVTSQDKEMIQSIEDLLENDNKRSYFLTDSMDELFDEFALPTAGNKGFLAKKLIISLCSQRKWKVSAFEMFLGRYNLIKNDYMRRVVKSGRTISGMLIDVDRVEYLSKYNAWSGYQISNYKESDDIVINESIVNREVVIKQEEINNQIKDLDSLGLFN